MKTKKTSRPGTQLTARFSVFSIVVGVSALIFAGGFWGVVTPRIQAIAKLIQRVERGQALAISAPKKQKTQSLKSDSDIMTRFEVLLPVMNQLIPVGDRRYDLTSELEALTASEGVILSGVGYTPGAAAARTAGGAADGPSPYASTLLPRLNVTFSVSGTYDQVQQFTRQTYRTKRFMEIDQILLTPTPGTDRVTAAFSMVVWYVEGVKPGVGAAANTSGTTTGFGGGSVPLETSSPTRPNEE
jgi:hypothetical protein